MNGFDSPGSQLNVWWNGGLPGQSGLLSGPRCRRVGGDHPIAIHRQSGGTILQWSSSGAVPAKNVCLLLKLLRWQALQPLVRENVMAKPNYHQARKQRELARKARQQEKLQRKSTRAKVVAADPPVEPFEGAAGALGTPLVDQG
jgi:hypothetical protein